MTRTLGAVAAALLLTTAAPAADVGFVEDFALARDRAAALRQLVPGTEDFYYYHALNHLNSEQYPQAEALLDPWVKRFGETARFLEIRTRLALLTADRDPQKALAYLRTRLGVRYDHQRLTPGTPPDLPTRLDPNLISREALTRAALTRTSDLSGFEDSALDRLATANLDPVRRRVLLQRLYRPDLPTLPQLVAADLAEPDAPGFGSYGIHGRLTLAQMDALLALRPQLRNEGAFVNNYLSKLRPGPDADWRRNPDATAAYLDRLLGFVRTLAPAHNSLKAHVLYQRLAADRSRGRFDTALFIEYLKLPRPAAYLAQRFVESDDFRRQPAADLNAEFAPVTALPPVRTDDALVRDYLKHFFLTADSTKEFEPYVNDVYLKQLFAETKIENGLGDAERWASDLPPAVYQALKDRIDIDFAPTNKSDYATDEPVVLDLHVKNVPTLLVKVFEVNTVNFYRTRKREIDTDVNLDGLVANSERAESYTDAPVRRVGRRFEFPQLTKPGVYVIDFIGAGKSSRALIRKGKLRPLVVTGPAGQRVTVVDETNQAVKDAAVWLGGKEYAADAGGVVNLPFSTAPGRQPIVLRRGDFASLGYLDHQPEGYRLTAGFHVDREALLARRTATLVIRPGLFLNDRAQSVRMLEEVKLTLVARDLDGTSTTSEVSDVRLFEDRETTHQFRVPPRLTQLSVTLRGKVKSLVTGAPVEVADSQTFTLNTGVSSDKIEAAHLAKFGSDYVLELLGRTGEGRGDRPVFLSLKHREFREPVYVTVKTDAAGRVQLGSLTDIETVAARTAEGVTYDWPLPADQATYQPTVHAKAGDVIGVPYPLVGPLTRDDVALFEVVGDVDLLMTQAVQRGGRTYTVTRPMGTVVSDRFENVSAAGGRLELKGLPAGDYDLHLKATDAHIRIRVSSGPAVGGFVLGPTRDLELPRLTPVRVASITADANAVTVKLADASPAARVHVIASRYLPEYRAFDYLSKVRDAAPTGVYPGRSPSVYLTGRNIGDEYRYVLDRKGLKKYPGNMLERPQLLLNPWAVRDAVTGEQEALAGGAFGMSGAQTAPKPAASAGGASTNVQFGGANGRGEAAGDPSLDFLAEPTVVLANLVPDKDGTLVIDRKLLGPHGFVTAVAVDPLNTTARSLALPETAAPKLDLRLLAGLDPNAHFVQRKEVSVLPPGQPVTVSDGGRFEVYDSVGKVFGLYSTLLNNDPTFAEFAFVTRWPSLKPEEKRALYSKYASHELSLFVWRKDPEFFAAVVKPYLANKKDPTFLDKWLLDADLGGYAEPWRYGRLNTAERALLGRKLAGERPKTVRTLSDLLKLQPPAADRERQLFEFGVMGTELDVAEKRKAGDKAALGVQVFGEDLAAPTAAAPPAPPGGPGRGGFGGGGGNMPGPAGPAGRPGSGPPPVAARPEAGRGANPLGRRDGAAKKSELAKELADSKDRAGTVELPDPIAMDADFFKLDQLERKQSAPLFRQVDVTKEWAENNYHRLPIQQHLAGLVPVSPFWAEYAAHEGNGPFLSRHLAAAARNRHEALLALAVLDLPFDAPNHKAEFAAGKLTFVPAGPSIAFREEVWPADKPDGKVPVLVSQNVYRHGDRYRDENGERLDKFVTGEFVVHAVYGTQVVVTNPGPSPQRLSVLLQVPVGAIPVAGFPALKSVLIDLQPYQTKALDYLFYFPKPGRFAHYPATVAKNETVVAAAKPMSFDVLPKPTKEDTASWEYVSQNGTPEQVLAFLDRENVHALNLDLIAWRMGDAAFFEQVTKRLADRHAYSPTLWSYALRHGTPDPARQYLLHADQLAQEVGGPLASTLVSYEPVERLVYEHLEYKPLVNARAHALGKRRQIVNARLHEQYHRFLHQVSYRRALTDEDHLTAVYYLLLQDRIEEAVSRFALVDPAKVPARVQYDYAAAYLALFDDDPARAKQIADRYTGHPVDRWKNLFAAVSSALTETPQVNDPLDRDQQQAKLAASEPAFEVAAEKGAAVLTHRNVGAVRVNYYLMDVELLFSTNPFVQQAGGGPFAVIKPNRTTELKLAAGQTRTVLPLPAEFARKNVLVEVTAAGKTRAVPVYASAMDVTMSDGYGQVRVTDAASGKPLAKVYVKAYVRTADGRVKFHKDGYTDHRGRFDYATVSTPEAVPPVRFAVLVLSEDAGATIREADPPQR